jgi:hypothetical protein
MGYIRKPQEVYRKVKTYIDDVLDYEPRKESDLDPTDL